MLCFPNVALGIIKTEHINNELSHTVGHLLENILFQEPLLTYAPPTTDFFKT